MTNREEIERTKLKVIIHKRSYNSYFNAFMLNLIVLFINIPFAFSNNYGHIFNAIGVGALIITLAYTWINMNSEYHDLKFYTVRLNSILMNDEYEIDRLNNLLKIKIYDKDFKNAGW